MHSTEQVHCFQGISRSATVVCAYLIATKRMLGVESIEFVQAKRGIVCPNNGFRQQLVTYSHRFTAENRKREGRGVFKLSEGIADRIRIFKSATVASKQNVP
jgi:protein-tyrosine phosphatase